MDLHVAWLPGAENVVLHGPNGEEIARLPIPPINEETPDGP